MRIMIGIAALVALGCGAAQAQDCHLQQYASLSFTQTPHGLVLPVRIGDARKDMTFSLNQASNAINSDIVRELGLRETTLSSHSHVHYNGADIYYSARAPRVTIDSDSFDNVDFLILPPKAHDRESGEIGTRQFANADIELDMTAGKLNLFASEHCPGKAVYWTATGFVKMPLEIDDHDYIRVQMQLDGKPVNLALSTEGGSTLGMNAMRRLFGLDENSPGMTLDHTNADGVKYYRYGFQKLEAEGLAINHPAILIREEREVPGCVTGVHQIPTVGQAKIDALHSTTCHGQDDGSLGLSVLGKLHLYVSKREKLLYLTGAAAH